MSQQDDNELWELLREIPEETAPQSPKKQPARKRPPAPAPKKSPWMFVSIGLGVALIGTVAMLLTGGSGSSGSGIPGFNSSAKVHELQAQVDSLTQERGQLVAQIDKMTDDAAAQEAKTDQLLQMYYEVCESLEHVEENNQFASTDPEVVEKNKKTIAAYKTLIQAQNAFLRYDEKTLTVCVESLMDKLDLLDQDALNAFYYVMEYMEQPYWKEKG